MNPKSKPFQVLAFVAIAFAMTGCGKRNSANGTPIGGNPYVQQNCMPGVPCTPFPGGTQGPFSSQTAPISGPIAFGGTMYIDSANVYGGMQFPQSQMQTNMVPVGQQMMGQNAYGTMVIQTVQQVGYNLYNVTGQITLSPQYVQTIMSQMGGYGGWGYPQQMVAGRVVAINVGHYNTTLYGGGFGGSSAAKIQLTNGATIDFFL